MVFLFPAFNQECCAKVACYSSTNTYFMGSPSHSESEVMRWHTEVLPRAALKALEFLAAQEWFKKTSWYLAGGTALTLSEGHRVSQDLDFFIREKAVKILRPKDIAVMKIIAISQRGRKRDFVDLYWHIKNREPLADILLRLPAQYPAVAHDYHHILKSLLYFEDAEEDPMPKLYFQASWKEIKKYFQREVPRITKEFLGLK